jgi:urease accessory protein
VTCTPYQEANSDVVSAEKTRMRASLRLAFASDEVTGKTALTFSHQDPPLRVVRAFHTRANGVMVHLHNVSGGLFGGDDLSLEVRVGKGAEVQLTTTGATRIYRCDPGSTAARQHNEFTISEGALLEYVPDAIIPYAGANFFQHTAIQLYSDAGLFWWEILAPGREARNEIFVFERVQMRTEIAAGDEVISIDRMNLEPDEKPVGSPGRLGSYRYCATFYICKVGVAAETWLELEQHLRMIVPTLPRIDDTLWGISTLKRHGLTVRCLAHQGCDVISGLFSLWDEAKFALYGRRAVRPRKTY